MTSWPSDIERAMDAACLALRDHYAHVCETAMRDVPMLNSALTVQVVGARPAGPDWLCILITPWFMNLVLLPRSLPVRTAEIGTKRETILPGGALVEFIQSHGEGLGPHRMCSLFSPVFEFETMEAAVLTAEAIMDELLAPSAEEQADDGMQAIWEGRLDDAEAQAEAERRLREAAETGESEPKAQLSRRALFGLAEKPGPEARP